MNKSSLKAFAIWGRNELREKIRIKLEILGIDEKGITEGETHNNLVSINGFEYNKGQYDSLVRKYNELGYNELVEEVAYTWFNRLTALAYMEINEYIDDRLIYSTTSKVEPDIIDNYMEAEFFERLPQDRKNIIHDLKDEHKLEEMYSILIEEKCHELSKIMEFMFEKSSDYTELLFPSGLLLEDSFLVRLREEIKESVEKIDREKRVPVELIGWLYQFYNSSLKAEVDEACKKGKKVTKETLPAKTQLFTPKWIVKYMVENSLGKLAVESLGVSEELKEKWKYCIEPEKREESVEKKEKLQIEDIKILDPAMGSGHMLTYSFDLLFDIYKDLSWGHEEAILSILKNNIYGLEIDDRAGMLASFAIMMKAREKFRRLFRVLGKLDEDKKFKFNTLAIQESNGIGEQTIKLIVENKLDNLNRLINTFQDGKEYGSILKIENINYEELLIENEKLKEVTNSQSQLDIFSGTMTNFGEDIELIDRLIHQAKLMGSKYDVTITNPPYMGGKFYSLKLKKYVEKYYKESKGDLFAVFIEICGGYTKKDRYTAMITMHSWMFLSSFERIRNKLIQTKEIDTMVHLGTRAFEEIGGEVVQTTSWITKNRSPIENGTFIRLVDYNNSKWKQDEFKNKENYFKTNQKNFSKIPGSPIAYWVTDRIKEIFETSEKLGEVGDAKQGLATANNDRFLRYWSEVDTKNYKLDSSNLEEAKESGKKWFPYNKGGENRKWYGNHEYLVNWENDGYEIKNFTDSKGKQRSVIRNPQFYFKESISWSDITSSGNSFRVFPKGFIHDVKGMSYFIKEKTNKLNLLGLLNNKLISKLSKVLNPTVSFQIGNFVKLPYLKFNSDRLNQMVQQNINIAKEEWDSRETSWNFTENQLIKNRAEKIENSIEKYESNWREKFFQIHSNEEKLNRLFIERYELQGEMDEKVALEDITLLKKEKKLEEIENVQCTIDNENLNKTELEQRKKLVFNRSELVKQFLSYAVGCIMGRYSVDKERLIIANSDDELIVESGKLRVESISGEIRHSIDNPRFTPDAFGIIPVTNERVFENDIITKIEEFVSIVYGSENLNENLEFIATHLGKKESESSHECIRRYFLKFFYSDHVSRYSKPGRKTPIYWMVSSGKEEGFSALVYMHRYRDNTIGRVRTDYLNRYQEVLETRFDSNTKRLEDDDLKPKEKKEIEKKIKTINGQIDELRKFALDVKDIADKKIVIDLDDGVKVNYAKFGKILKKI